MTELYRGFIGDTSGFKWGQINNKSLLDFMVIFIGDR
ncbi:MAG: hypothetical protein H6R05_207 [Burkholderiaceae bacterium]|nr:hypothetical protein [Burkholderiaceae bacterium]